MSALRAYGVGLALPRGWDGRIFRRTDADEGLAPAALGGPRSASLHPVVHVANFALPEDRGDYGSGAVERMGPAHVLVCLLEFEASSCHEALFSREGVPRLRAVSYSPHTMQRTIAGMCGMQAFFQVHGRAFCVYSVLGSHRGRYALAPLADRALAGIEIHPYAE